VIVNLLCVGKILNITHLPAQYIVYLMIPPPCLQYHTAHASTPDHHGCKGATNREEDNVGYDNARDVAASTNARDLVGVVLGDNDALPQQPA
jgi:hypothetical protein